MEKISNEPLIIIDGAHNTHAMERLVETVREEFTNYRIHILFSALETKNVDEMLQQLLTIPKAEIYLTTFDFPKAIHLSDDYQQLNEARISIVSLWQFGLAELLEKMTNEDLLLITGSLYLYQKFGNFCWEWEEEMAELNGVIFDMDGLIFDTELLYYQATQIVADQMAIPYAKDVYLAYVGVSDEEVWAAYHERYDAAFGPEIVDRFIQAAFDQTLLLFEQGQAALKRAS